MNFDDYRRGTDPKYLVQALEVIAENGIPAPALAWVTDVGSEPFLSFLEDEILVPLIESGRSTCRFFEAPYGTGKTHLLDLIQTVGHLRRCVVVHAELGAAVKFEDWRSIAKHFLQEMTYWSGDSYVKGLPEVLASLHERGVDCTRLSERRFPHAGFARAISLLAQEGRDTEGFDAISDYLRGERVRVADLRVHGVTGVTDSLSDRNAEHVIETVTAALQLLSVNGTLIVFDETERSFERAATSLRVSRAGNIMRRFVDACFTNRLRGVLAVFAVLPDFVGRCTQAYAALGQRLRRPYDFDGVWRWPVLPVTRVAPLNAEDFASQAVARVAGIAELCGVTHPRTLQSRLTGVARVILDSNAGSGYKRELMKGLCEVTLQELEQT